MNLFLLKLFCNFYQILKGFSNSQIFQLKQHAFQGLDKINTPTFTDIWTCHERRNDVKTSGFFIYRTLSTDIFQM